MVLVLLMVEGVLEEWLLIEVQSGRCLDLDEDVVSWVDILGGNLTILTEVKVWAVPKNNNKCCSLR